MSTQLARLTTAQIQALIAGIPKYCPNVSLIFGGTSYTATEAVALLNTVLASTASVASSKASYSEAVAAARTVTENEGHVARELREVIGLMFSSSPATLAAMAIVPRKVPKPLTAEARAVAEAKARATRLARGTKSKKQKAAISGDVTGVTITPITTGTAEATSPATTGTPSSAASVTPASSSAPAVTPLATGTAGARS